MIELKRRYRCSYCGGSDHKVSNCAIAEQERIEQSTTRLEIVDESIEQIAKMRAECDALAIETIEYEAVQERTIQRILENRSRMIALQVAIAKLRRDA